MTVAAPARPLQEAQGIAEEAPQGGSWPPLCPSRPPLPLIIRVQLQKRTAGEGERPDPVKTHLRNMIIIPEMIGSIIGVYNGKVFLPVEVKVRVCVCEYSRAHGTMRGARAPLTAAGDDWPLPGRVLHRVQAHPARQARSGRHPLLQVHPHLTHT